MQIHLSEIIHLSEESTSGSEKTSYKAYVTFQPDERVRLGMSVIVYPNNFIPDDEEPGLGETEKTDKSEED